MHMRATTNLLVHGLTASNLHMGVSPGGFIIFLSKQSNKSIYTKHVAFNIQTV